MAPSSVPPTKPKGSSSSLEFVSISHPDEIRNRRNKRKIRQHAMKDIGLARRKRPSQPTRPEGDNSHARHGTLPETSAPSTDLMLYSETDIRAKKLESFLLREKSPLFVKIRELCFSMALIDDSAFHLALALSEHHQEGSHFSQEENPVAMSHYNISLRIIHENLQLLQATVGAVCRGVIIVVIGFASYDVLLSIGHTERWEMHMVGLDAMIRGRGGLHTLNSSYLLQSLLWTDVVGCLSLDRPPRFVVSLDGFGPTRVPEISPVLGRTLKALEDLSPQLSEICSVLESLTGVAKASEEGLTELYCMTLARCAYILLSASRSSSADLAGLSTPLAVAACTPRSTGLVPHGSRLSETLRSQECRWFGLEELQLWVLVVAAVAEGEDTQWVAIRISHLMQALKLDWHGVKVVLSQIAWVGGVFDQQMAKLGATLG
ncbi:hypothetical protein ACJ41O_000216 [Fusarium nematophilum]